MNWVGGKLHRHSKANTNARVKTQKQHFAKARLQAQAATPAPSPIAFPIFDGLFDQSRSRSKLISQGNPQRKVHPAPRATITHQTSPSHRDHPRHKRKHQDPPSSRGSSLPDPPRSFAFPQGQRIAKRRRKNDNSALNTIDDVKRNLLRRSDWMGLNATRPVKMHFAQPEETEKIGRRRKITSEDCRRREKALRKEQIRYNLIQPFERPHGFGHDSPRNREDFSIRIGSNIHQTETQTSHRPSPTRKQATGIEGSVSSESMLLDKNEENLVNNSIDFAPLLQISEHSNLEMNASPLFSNRNGSYEDGPPVLPLNTVLDLDSFDKVKERSSSIHRNIPSISSQHRHPTRAHPPAKSRVRGDSEENAAKEDHTSYGSSNSLPQQPSFGRSSEYGAPELRQRTNFPSNPDSPSEGLRPRPITCQSKSFQNIDPSNHEFVNPKRRLSQYHKHQVTPSHRRMFTIERQALLETCALGSESSSINHGQESPFYFIQRGHQKRAQLLGYHEDSEGPHSRFGVSGPEVDTLIAKEAARLGPLQSASGSNSQVDFHRQESGIIPKFPEQGRRSSKYFVTRESSKLRPSVSSPPLNRNPRTSLAGSIEDENEAWMKFVFAGDFSKIQKGFEFSPSNSKPRQKTTHLIIDSSVRSSAEENRLLQALSWTTTTKPFRSPAPTIQTSANTIMYRPHQIGSPQSLAATLPSETDFLSRLSPMEGHFDDGLGNLSLYNNAARTVKSFVPGHEVGSSHSHGVFDRSEFPTSPPISSVPAKRRVESTSFYSHNDLMSPKRARRPRPEGIFSHRQPLQSIRQPLHRSPLQIKDSDFSPTQSPRNVLQNNASRTAYHPVWMSQTPRREGRKFPLSYSPRHRSLASSRALKTGKIAHYSTSPTFSSESIDAVPKSGISIESKNSAFIRPEEMEYGPFSQAGDDPTRQLSHFTSLNADLTDLHSTSSYLRTNSDIKPLLNIYATQVAPSRSHLRQSQRVPVPRMGEISPRPALLTTPRPKNSQTFQQWVNELKMNG